MDDQQLHDQRITSKPDLKGSREKLEALLAAKSASSAQPSPSTAQGAFDPLSLAMKDHPGLTREGAEQMARAFGF